MDSNGVLRNNERAMRCFFVLCQIYLILYFVWPAPQIWYIMPLGHARQDLIYPHASGKKILPS